MSSGYQPRRFNGKWTGEFQKEPKRSDPEQFSPLQQMQVDLEKLAVEFTIGGHHGWADRTRDIARRLA